ncbi:MAG TPA: NAD(P)-binding domain-containing protein [Chloroflexota bacterium]|nr:NAD(P)-binding domain-containing protein [Chloroflexota bacterium]
MIVGIAGLGSRGRAIGSRLQATGQRVLGYDPDVATAASSGFRTVGAPDRLAQQCALQLVACDGQLAEALIRELLDFQGMTSLQAIALCGVLDPRRVRDLAAQAAGKGVALLDTPVDGGEPAIQSGRAVVFAGGTETAIEDFRKPLQALGELVYVGEAGSGQIARTVNDLLRLANVLAISDAFNLVRACGADPTPIREAVLRASGSNRALEEWGREGEPAIHEEIQAALELARETGAAMPFLHELDSLLERLDSDQLSGLFNLGIVDLSAHDQPEFSEDEAEAAAEPSAPISLAAAPEPQEALLPAGIPELPALAADGGVATLAQTAAAPPPILPEPQIALEPEPEPSPRVADHLEPPLEEPALLESFGLPAAEADEGWELDMAESELSGGEPTLS